jgi:hypothetical protein
MKTTTPIITPTTTNDDDNNNSSFVFFTYTGSEEDDAIPIDITHVRIHPTVTNIPDFAFHGRTKLQSIEFHNNLKSIGNSAFGECTSLHQVTIPPGTSIGRYAFAGCTNLIHVELLGSGEEEEETTIGTMAFYHCTNLIHINIPSSTTTTATPLVHDEELNGKHQSLEDDHDEGIIIIGDASDPIWKRSWQRNRMLLCIAVTSLVAVMGAFITGVMFSSKGEISSPAVVIVADIAAAAAGKRNDDTSDVSPTSSEEMASKDDDSQQQQVVVTAEQPPIMEESSSCIIVNVTLDQYPADTSWNIQHYLTNDNGGSNSTPIIASSTPFNASMTSSNEVVCLSKGEYSFTIFDEYGDGICCGWGMGSYTVSTANGLVIASGGEFKNSEVTLFSIPYNHDGGDDDGGGGPTTASDDSIIIQVEQQKSPSSSPAPADTTPSPTKTTEATTTTTTTPVPSSTKQQLLPSPVPTTESPAKPSSCTTIEISITLDDYPMDTSWNITDSTTDTVVKQSSPYEKSMAQTTQVDQVCLMDGSYTFVIFDAYEDGICCNWGEGKYILQDPSGGGAGGGEIFVSGGEWIGPSDTRSFTITGGFVSSSSSQSIPTISPPPPTTTTTTNKPTSSNPTNPPSSPPTPNPTTRNTTTTTTCTTIEISITLDNYPQDTSWTIFESTTNKTLFTSPSYNESMANSIQVTSECLFSGSYAFVIYDVYGDGICCKWGEGSYRLKLSGGDDDDDVIVADGGEWVGPNETKNFTIA